MVSEKFRSIFSKKKKESEEDELVQELHDVFQDLEEARAEQLVMSSIAKEKKEESNVPVSVEEDRETVEVEQEDKKSEQSVVSVQEIQKEVKLEKEEDITSSMSSVTSLFEIFKTEFLEYIVDKSFRDQKTRDLLFKTLDKLSRDDLIEIVKILYRIVDSKLSTGLTVPESTQTTQKQPEQTIGEQQGGTRPISEMKEKTVKEGEEKLDLSSLLGGS